MSRRLQTVAAVTCMKLMLLLFHVIFWVAGIVILSFGLWMKLSLHYLLDLSDGYSEAVPYIFIGTGAMIIVVSLFACCCTVKGQPILLYMLSIFLSLVLICEVAAGIAGYTYRQNIQAGFEMGLNNSIDHYGSGSIRDRDIDMLQKVMKCCGVKSYEDWNNKWQNASVPQSCCKNITNCHYAPVDVQDIYNEGCYVKAVDFINSNLGALLGGVAGLAVFQLLGVILSCCLAKYADKAKYEPVA